MPAAIGVKPITDAQQAPIQEAWVYVQQAALLSESGDHIGPLAEYTHEHAISLRR